MCRDSVVLKHAGAVRDLLADLCTFCHFFASRSGPLLAPVLPRGECDD